MLVLSPKNYNQKTNLMLCCPMTSKIKNYPFEVLISSNSAVLSDQIKSLDFVKREVKFKEKATMKVLQQVRQNAKALIGGKM